MKRALQIFVAILGTVAAASGLSTVVFGAGSILGHGSFTPSLDSEVRFFAAWYVAAGLVLLWAVPRIESAGTIVRVVAGAFFLAACGRLISLVVEGRPHNLALVLMFVEWALSLLVPWQAAVARREGGGS